MCLDKLKYLIKIYIKKLLKINIASENTNIYNYYHSKEEKIEISQETKSILLKCRDIGQKIFQIERRNGKLTFAIFNNGEKRKIHDAERLTADIDILLHNDMLKDIDGNTRGYLYYQITPRCFDRLRKFDNL